MGNLTWDRNDPVNAGIQSVRLVAGAAGVLVRRVRYIEPVTGTEYVFITHEMDIRPGLIALLYATGLRSSRMAARSGRFRGIAG